MAAIRVSTPSAKVCAPEPRQSGGARCVDAAPRRAGREFSASVRDLPARSKRAGRRRCGDRGDCRAGKTRRSDNSWMREGSHASRVTVSAGAPSFRLPGRRSRSRSRTRARCHSRRRLIRAAVSRTSPNWLRRSRVANVARRLKPDQGIVGEEQRFGHRIHRVGPPSALTPGTGVSRRPVGLQKHLDAGLDGALDLFEAQALADASRRRASREFKRAGRQRDDARNRLGALLVVGDHAAADAERLGSQIERVGLALAPALATRLPTWRGRPVPGRGARASRPPCRCRPSRQCRFHARRR